MGGAVGDSQANVAEVVGRLDVVGGFAYFLYGAHHEAHQDGDDGDHHQEFDQRETCTLVRTHFGTHLTHGITPPRVNWPTGFDWRSV